MSAWKKTPRWKNRPNTEDGGRMGSYGGMDDYIMDSGNYGDNNTGNRFNQQFRDVGDSYGSRNFQPSLMNMFDSDPFRDMREPSSLEVFEDPFRDMREPSSSNMFERDSYMDADFREQDVYPATNRQQSIADKGYGDYRAGGISSDLNFYESGGSNLDNFSMQRSARFQMPMNQYGSSMNQMWTPGPQSSSMMEFTPMLRSNAMSQQQGMQGFQNTKFMKKQKWKQGLSDTGLLPNPRTSDRPNWNAGNAGSWSNSGGQQNKWPNAPGRQRTRPKKRPNLSAVVDQLNKEPALLEKAPFIHQGKGLTRTIKNSQAQAPALCKTCNLTFFPHAELVKHLASNAHKFKKQLRRTQNAENFKKKHGLKTAAELKAAADNPDHMIAEGNHYCDLCRLTYEGSVLMHRRSKGHKENKTIGRPYCTLCKQYFRTPGRYVKHCRSLYHKLQRRDAEKAVKDAEEGEAEKAGEADNSGKNGEGNIEKKKAQGGKKAEGKEQSDEFFTVDAVGIYEGSGDHEVINLDESSGEGEGLVHVQKKRKKNVQKRRIAKKGTAKRPVGKATQVKKKIPEKSAAEGQDLDLSGTEAVGESFIVAGFYCQLCSEFFEHEQFARTVHCRCEKHCANYKTAISTQNDEEKSPQGSDNEELSGEKMPKAGDKQKAANVDAETGDEEVAAEQESEKQSNEASTPADAKQTKDDEAEDEKEGGSDAADEEADKAESDKQANDANEKETEKQTSAESESRRGNDSDPTKGNEDDDDSCEVCFESIREVVIKEEDD